MIIYLTYFPPFSLTCVPLDNYFVLLMNQLHIPMAFHNIMGVLHVNPSTCLEWCTQSSSQVESWTQLPLFQDLADLADGVGLCSLLAFYCQEELALSEISVPNPGEALSVSDSLWNLQLVHRVCRDSLPYNVCHFTYEDVLYLHESMKQNMLNFLADLFNHLELQPANCVKLLGSHQMIPIRPTGTSLCQTLFYILIWG